MQRNLKILIIFLAVFTASYSYAAIKYNQRISAYDAAKSQILRNMAENSSYSILQKQHYQTISRLSNDINRNRYYSPALGRFISKDPISFSGGNNLYRYADNNPILFTDPFGLWTMNVGNSDLASKIKQAVSDRLTGAVISINGKKYLLEAGWKSGADIANDFSYGTPPQIDFVDGIWPDFGYDNGANGTKIAAELLDMEFLKTDDSDSLAYVIADTIIHEMSHWKNRVNGTTSNPMQGWNFMTNAFGYQKVLKVTSEDINECPTSITFTDAKLLLSE